MCTVDMAGGGEKGKKKITPKVQNAKSQLQNVQGTKKNQLNKM